MLGDYDYDDDDDDNDDAGDHEQVLGDPHSGLRVLCLQHHRCPGPRLDQCARSKQGERI